jgi:hypothetical protein
MLVADRIKKRFDVEGNSSAVLALLDLFEGIFCETDIRA